MQEEGVLNWEKIVIVLIGIVILASIFLVLRSRHKAKLKRIEQDELLKKSRKQVHDNA